MSRSVLPLKKAATSSSCAKAQETAARKTSRASSVFFIAAESSPSSLLKKVFEVSRWATLIQDPSARRTKDSQPSGFGFEYCASHVGFRVFQQTARVDPPARRPSPCRARPERFRRP